MQPDTRRGFFGTLLAGSASLAVAKQGTPKLLPPVYADHPSQDPRTFITPIWMAKEFTRELAYLIRHTGKSTILVSNAEFSNYHKPPVRLHVELDEIPPDSSLDVAREKLHYAAETLAYDILRSRIKWVTKLPPSDPHRSVHVDSKQLGISVRMCTMHDIYRDKDTLRFDVLGKWLERGYQDAN